MGNTGINQSGSQKFICCECFSLIPATHWLGHVKFHGAMIRMSLLSSGIKPAAAEHSAARAMTEINFEPYYGV